jgi:hypothetical protein
MPYVKRDLTVMEIVSDFDISLEAAENAYNNASNRIAAEKSQLEDYEVEFINEFIAKK